MSWAPLVCDDCQQLKTFDKAAPYPGGDRVYGVAWLCQICGHRSIDVCVAGPDLPSPSTCLNCGGKLVDCTCQDCGTSRQEVLNRIRKECSDEANLLVAAEEACKKGLIRLALNMLDYRLETYPEEMEAWRSKSILLQSIGLYVPSIPALKKAVDLSGPPTLLISLGCAYYETDAYEDAVEIYERFRRENPGDDWVAVSLSNQANALDRLQRFEEAGNLHKGAIEKEPDRAVFRLNLRTHFAVQKLHEQALDAVDAALACATPEERSRVLHLRAETLCELERGDDALRDIEASLKEMPGEPSRTYVLGWALGLVGRIEEAHDAMMRVLAVAPDHAAARRGLGMIEDALRNALPNDD